MRLFTSFLLILFFCLGAVESYSKEYRKKKQNYHSLGAGIGIARLTTDMGDDYNPGTTFYGAYTYTIQDIFLGDRALFISRGEK